MEGVPPGIFLCPPAIILEVLLNPLGMLTGIAGAAVNAFITAGLVEESIKLLVIMLFVSNEMNLMRSTTE